MPETLKQGERSPDAGCFELQEGTGLKVWHPLELLIL